MKLDEVATKAASDAVAALGASLSEAEQERVAAIIAKAMESAVHEASDQHANACERCLTHDLDLAHKIQKEIERKKIGLIANLSSLR